MRRNAAVKLATCDRPLILAFGKNKTSKLGEWSFDRALSSFHLN